MRKGFGGHDLSNPINRLLGKIALAVNVRAYVSGSITLRTALTNAIVTVSAGIQTVARLNDSTPAGPAQGYSYIIAGGTILHCVTVPAPPDPIATGMSGNPVSTVPFRPNASVQPWLYIGDGAPTPTGPLNFVTIDTEYAHNGTPTTFACSGMVKVRSDGLIYKMGIREPQWAPVVSTMGTTTTGTATLAATAVPWNNVGGVNSSYNYGQTNAADGTPPVIILTPTGSQTLQLTITGSATVNGSVQAPSAPGPQTSAYPGHFVTGACAIIVAAFTDGSGNVLTGSSPPIPFVASVGALVTLSIPVGAVQCQIGIDSSANTFSSNSGSFSLAWILTQSAIATAPSTIGLVTAYSWGDSPHSGPVATYLWKAPSDVGSGIPRTASTAPSITTNNSWQVDTTPAVVNSGVLPQWDTLLPNGTVSGDIPLFPAPFPQSAPLTNNFNTCMTGSIFFPSGGVYTLTLVYKDQIMLGIGGGVTASYASGVMPASYSPSGFNGQTISVASGLPLVFVSAINGGGTQQTTSLTLNVPGSGGIIQFEIDWDFWYHSGRSLVMTINGAVIKPVPSGARVNTSYISVYRSSLTGALSNPGPASTPQVTPVLDNTVTSPYSLDPQVDKVDYYRQDSGLPNYTYAVTGPNDGLGPVINGIQYNTPVTDSLSDLAISANPIAQFDNFEPFPSIDLPASGVLNISGGVATWVSGTHFNIRWLPGTVILVGTPTQLAYTSIRRPTSSTSWDFTGLTNPIPDGTNLTFNIAEPILAAQPLAYLGGPTDNINFIFAVGDPLRPGTLYWCKGSNLDSAPDTNQMDVTDPSEPLVNVVMSGGRGVLFSIKRAWVIMPNFFNAEATVTGTAGSTWTLQATSITRGLFIPRCLAVSGGGTIFFRVDDGIHASPGGLGSESITDGDLYPLFPHEGSTPSPIVRAGITIYPPNDAFPQRQQFHYNNGYLYWDHYGTDNAYHTLVFDEAAGGWIFDLYSVSVITHASNESESTQGILTGSTDGTLRQMSTTGPEVVTGTILSPALGGQGWMQCQEFTVEYSSNANVIVTPLAADAGNGSISANPVTLPSTGGTIAKTKVIISANKFKLMWFQFQSTDSTFRVFTEGFVCRVKSWGVKEPFRNLNPFMMLNPYFPSVGGQGGQQ